MIFLLKLLLVPILIALVTLAGSRWGPQVAGWLSAFPIVSGPILLVMSLEQGAAFAVALLRGMVDGYYAFAAFCLALSLLLRAQPIGMAFLLATGAALVVQVGVKWIGAPQRARRGAAA